MFPTLAPGDVIGRYGNEFQMAGAGARSLGMGGACVALTDDAWALFWNPAGLAAVSRFQIGLMHNERFAGTVDYDAVSYAQPHNDGSILALGMLRLGVNGIAFTDLEHPGQPLSGDNRVEIDKIVNDGEYAFYVAKAKTSLLDTPLGSLNWSWGLAPKFVFKHIGNYRAYGLGLDVGLGKTFKVGVPLRFGLGVRDLLGTVVTWEQTGRKEIIPSTARLGLAAPLSLPPLEAVLTPVIDAVYRFDLFGGSDAASLHYGAEYLVRDVVALRAGADDGELTIGGGIRLRAVDIDYAFIGHNDLGDSHRISVTARWGRR
ncbi:MAG: UPF0164 family protein [Calditrichaeota bacterium]|nr:UPF0164 family protein [Calditrichota bacterium]